MSALCTHITRMNRHPDSMRATPVTHTNRVTSSRTMSAKRAAAIWLVLVAIALGSVPLVPMRVFEALLPSSAHGASTDMAAEIVRTLRLPRAVAGFACGALLALAGALLQVLLRNPLAEPYVLGVSGGAATFALVAMIAGCAWWIVDASAFAGTFVSILLVLELARRELWRGEPQDTSPRLLFTGAVISAGWGALITLLLNVAPDSRLRGMLFWLTGDLNGNAMPWTARDVLSLSGGERQRVALAAVLCQEAPLLLLDEPLSHLDLHHQIDCLEALCTWAREPRRTVLFSCHDLNLARRFATHALLLDGEGGAYPGAVRDVLTSRAFGYPLILIRDGEHEALIPVPRVQHESAGNHDTAAY
ncbi:MAG: Vitamin B12 ABC transporter, permease component BtuC [uncultured Paraburkholderia sp.]|nr:MAG: Vitamin B12 ABC transporter, permease component BtuC [uncultured Paraburkholderia sp.]CAH2928140.1 MAG: Vitamin B12 ABC transporter, permease component BtuC [uncultured Paraburkholderia sp.]